MALKISQAELEHVIHQFTSKDMYKDMAMFFITQEVDIDDIFLCEVFGNEKFYDNVFKYVANYLVDKYNTHRFGKTMWEISTRFRFDNYTKVCGYPSRDYHVSKFIASLIKYFITVGDTLPILDMMDALFSNSDVNSMAIADIIIHEKHCHHSDLFLHLIRNGNLSVEHIIDLITINYKYDKNPDNLLAILDEFALSRDSLLLLINKLPELFVKYRYGNDKDTKHIYIKPIANGVTGKVHDLLRLALSSSVKADAELDLQYMLAKNIDIYEENNDYSRYALYIKIRDYLLNLQEEERNNNLFFYDVADYSLELTDEEFGLICQDILTWMYIREDRHLSPWEVFIRVYNINTHKFLHGAQLQSIREALIEKYSEFGDLVLLALDDRVLDLINF